MSKTAVSAVQATMQSLRVGKIFGPPGSMRRPIVFMIIALIISSIIAPSFLTFSNISALLVSSSFLIVLAVGESFVIMTGMIDLGVESVLASGGMFVAFISVFGGWPAALSVPVGLILGGVVGLLVGILITKGRIPSFIVTLAVYWGFKGVALLFNGGNYISPSSGSPPQEFFGFSAIAGKSFGMSNLFWISMIIVAGAQLMLSYTPLGTWLKSIGSNESSTKTVGLNTDRLKILVFVISGMLAVLAGIMISAWQGSMYPDTAAGFSLEAIASVILGGIPFSGGRGSVVGAALGALIIGLINDLIVLLGLPSLYEYIFVAIILIVAGLQARAKGFVK
ncbi:MAG: ABC transporter permease [Bacilli bacterium]